MRTNGNTNREGAVGELTASLWLMGLGYEVFRNVGFSGPADLVAWMPTMGETHFIDVKTVNQERFRADGGRTVVVCGRPRPDSVKLLMICKGQVIGFWRRAGNRTIERYWPLSVPDSFA